MNIETKLLDFDKENIPTLAKPKSASCSRAFGTDLTKVSNSSTIHLENPYIDLIILYLQNTQFHTILSKDYLHFQPEISEKMRLLLINWLSEIHSRFLLQPETLFLAVNILDRYLAEFICSSRKLQLVGIVSLWLASKFEEIYYISLTDLLHLCSNVYTKEDVLLMERNILKMLDYRLCTCSSYRLALLICAKMNVTKSQINLVQYLLVVSLISYNMIKYNSNTTANAAIYLMCSIENIENSIEITQTMKNCIKDILILVREIKKNPFLDVFKKYSNYQKYFLCRINLN